MQWYVDVLKHKYVDFGGRAGRAEYWWFSLVSMIVSIVMIAMDGVIGMITPGAAFGFLSAIYGLGIFLPTLSVTVRRLQDTGRSFWWMFVSLVPLVGMFVLVYFLAADGDPSANAFGPNPDRASSQLEKAA